MRRLCNPVVLFCLRSNAHVHHTERRVGTDIPILVWRDMLSFCFGPFGRKMFLAHYHNRK